MKPISNRITDAIWGFVAVYILAFVVLVLALIGLGLDQVTAWSAVGATINNLGPGLGKVALHYGELDNSQARLILCLNLQDMLSSKWYRSGLPPALLPKVLPNGPVFYLCCYFSLLSSVVVRDQQAGV